VLSEEGSGGVDELGGGALEPLEHGALDLVQPPVVLDHAYDAQKSGLLLRGQEKDDDALRALRFHIPECEPAGRSMGAGSVNAGRTSG
jgi:hypothetical protein